MRRVTRTGQVSNEYMGAATVDNASKLEMFPFKRIQLGRMKSEAQLRRLSRIEINRQ